jgi:hypothetical protein
MRKLGMFVIFVVVLLIVVNVGAQFDTGGLEQGVEGVKETAGNIKEYTEKEKWEYLSEQWKEILLKSEFISGLDAFLSKINIVFVVVLGQNYELSMLFFFSIIFWILAFFILASAFPQVLPTSKYIAVLVALITTIILGHVNVYEGLSLFTFKLLFFKGGVWSWIWFVIFLVLYVLVLTFVRKYIVSILKGIKERKKKGDLEHKVKKSESFIEGFKEGAS